MAGVITAYSPPAGSLGRSASHATGRWSGCAVDRARHPHSADRGALLRTYAPEPWLHEPWQQANTRLPDRGMVFRQFRVYARYLKSFHLTSGNPGFARRQSDARPGTSWLGFTRHPAPDAQATRAGPDLAAVAFTQRALGRWRRAVRTKSANGSGDACDRHCGERHIGSRLQRFRRLFSGFTTFYKRRPIATGALAWSAVRRVGSAHRRGDGQ